jgi:Predicted Permease Membrane Region
MDGVVELFRRYPELAVCLAVGVGYWIGSFKVRGVSLGGVTGSLLAGIAIWHFFHVPVTCFAGSLVFMLFLFGIGCSVRLLSGRIPDGVRVFWRSCRGTCLAYDVGHGNRPAHRPVNHRPCLLPRKS